MNAAHEELFTMVTRLDENQTRKIIEIIRILYDESVSQDAGNYNETEDPFINGFVEGSPDLAIRAEEILQENLTDQVWSWKQDE